MTIGLKVDSLAYYFPSWWHVEDDCRRSTEERLWC